MAQQWWIAHTAAIMCMQMCLALQRKNSFFSAVAFHSKVPSSLLCCLDGNAAQMDERCFRLSFRRGCTIQWRIVYLLSQNRMELFPWRRYHLSQFSLSSGQLIRLSILHTYKFLSAGLFGARQTTGPLCCQLFSGRQTTKVLIYL